MSSPNRTTPFVPIPVSSSSDSIVRNPDDHRTGIRLQLLLRVASSATDENINQSDELRHEWQKHLVVEAKSDTGPKKKKAETVGMTLSPEQAYHVEFSLPSEESLDWPPDRQYPKFFLDIINLQCMAKVYYGAKSGSFILPPNLEQHEFSLLIAWFNDWMLLKLVIVQISHS